MRSYNVCVPCGGEWGSDGVSHQECPWCEISKLGREKACLADELEETDWLLQEGLAREREYAQMIDEAHHEMEQLRETIHDLVESNSRLRESLERIGKAGEILCDYIEKIQDWGGTWMEKLINDFRAAKGGQHGKSM